MVSPYADQSRDGNIAISLGPRFSGETEGTGEIAMPISASRLHAVDEMTIGRLGASISRDEKCLRVRIWSCGLIHNYGHYSQLPYTVVCDVVRCDWFVPSKCRIRP